MLLVVLIAIFFSGCISKAEPKAVGVQKCKIPYTQPPVYDNKIYTNPADIVAKTLKNDALKTKYIKDLLEAQKVCE
ncbi:MAG: hypothetical protein PHI79_04275 [Sulfurovaceae bacterium]|nr:hypothetical protein [Sulfurovaceae bacterium]